MLIESISKYIETNFGFKPKVENNEIIFSIKQSGVWKTYWIGFIGITAENRIRDLYFDDNIAFKLLNPGDPNFLTQLDKHLNVIKLEK